MFISDKFYFNNIHCDEKCVSIANTDSSFFEDYGINYSEELSLSKTSNIVSFYDKEETQAEKITMQLYLTDAVGNPAKWEYSNIDDVMDWLITEDFAPFISEDNLDRIYYLKCISIKRKFTPTKTGYLEVEFQPYSQYSYRNFNRKFIVIDKKELVFYNYSNVNHDYAPIIEIENLGDEKSEIKITNLTTSSEAFIIKGLKVGEKVVIDNLIGTVVNSLGENLISKCNRKWVKIGKDNNNIRFEGKSNMVLKAQYPIR